MKQQPEQPCPACQARGKEWQGSDPKCAFVNGVFTPDNYLCATLAPLREICGEDASWNDDEMCGIMPGADSHHIVLTWYKRRGATTGAYMITDGIAQPLTLEEAQKAGVGKGLKAPAVEAQAQPQPSSTTAGDRLLALYDQAVALVKKIGIAGPAPLQQHLGLNYYQSSLLLEAMETAGIVGAPDTHGHRTVLITKGETA